MSERAARPMWETVASAWPPLIALGAVVLLSIGMLVLDLAVDSSTASETDHLVENSLRSVALADDLRYQAYRLTVPNLTKDQIKSIAEQIDQDAAAYEPLTGGDPERLAWTRLQGLLAHLRAEQPFSAADDASSLVSDIETTIAKLVEINQTEARIYAREIGQAHSEGLVLDAVVLVITIGLVAAVALALLRALRRQRGLLRVHLASLDERNRDLAAFASRASHDLKGPLSPIGGYADILTVNEDPYVQDLGGRIRRSVDRMVGIIDDLLEISVHGKPSLGTAELRPLVTEVVEDIKDADVKLDVADVKVACSAGVLGQVLRNLVINASKYRSPDRPLELSVKAKRSDRTVEIVVADNGIGMDAETLAHAFEPYYRAPGSSSPGHGLGLAIVRRTLEAIGGSVSLSSRPAQGTNVIVRVPAAP